MVFQIARWSNIPNLLSLEFVPRISKANSAHSNRCFLQLLQQTHAPKIDHWIKVRGLSICTSGYSKRPHHLEPGVSSNLALSLSWVFYAIKLCPIVLPQSLSPQVTWLLQTSGAHINNLDVIMQTSWCLSTPWKNKKKHRPRNSSSVYRFFRSLSILQMTTYSVVHSFWNLMIGSRVWSNCGIVGLLFQVLSNSLCLPCLSRKAYNNGT